jgi:uncharacterized protein YcfJ
MKGSRFRHRLLVTSSLVAGVCVFNASALASGASHIDRARVVSVDPVVRTVTISTPRQECWDEVVTVQQPTNGKTYTPEILGSILGAAVGNQFGGGRGRDVATIAGAVLGGSLGHDIKRRRSYASQGSREVVEQRCRTINEQHVEERIDGYEVTYRFRGRDYATRMPYDPGDHIPVRVTVEPVE